jgi:Uma2 family endonuclease
MLTTPIQFRLEPGQTITLAPVVWQGFEMVLIELGERRSSRIAYANGVLEIMAPLPDHERSKIVIADLVKLLLRKQGRSWEPLGSTTLKRESMKAGIEPDECFYIQNYRAVIGKQRLDLSIDPPPDLAIETDVTSKTESAAYTALGIPELWIYANGKLAINLLQHGEYIESDISPTFPTLPIKTLIPQTVQRSLTVGVSQALAEFESSLE